VAVVPNNNNYIQRPENSAKVEKKMKKTTTTKQPNIRLLLKSNSQLTSKKKVIEMIDIICDAVPISYAKSKDDDRFFSYDKASDYPKGPSGLQITQTPDQQRYYATMMRQQRLKNPTL